MVSASQTESCIGRGSGPGGSIDFGAGSRTVGAVSVATRGTLSLAPHSAVGIPGNTPTAALRRTPAVCPTMARSNHREGRSTLGDPRAWLARAALVPSEDCGRRVRPRCSVTACSRGPHAPSTRGSEGVASAPPRGSSRPSRCPAKRPRLSPHSSGKRVPQTSANRLASSSRKFSRYVARSRTACSGWITR